eukprot:TRINITY_DN20866_c0_g2_i1.p1 TRINITY_DN20866_c0_g2~~TRINITY_DN20866_c0_g2_i1.p1  ORF type:complete len:138 (-),score=23.72 TRINITY_DN20866_c0_g2_i1:543-956(-)
MTMQVQSSTCSIFAGADDWSGAGQGLNAECIRTSMMSEVHDNEGREHQPNNGTGAGQLTASTASSRTTAACQGLQREFYDLEPMACMERSAKERRLLEKMQGHRGGDETYILDTDLQLRIFRQHPSVHRLCVGFFNN